MVTEKAPETQAERVETIRDIERQVARLAGEDAPQEIIFKDISPGRRKTSLWRVRDGREIQVPAYMLRSVLAKRGPDGAYIFTGTQASAAEWKPGTVLCFLHADSPEQEILREIGLSANTCPAGQLRNNHSKRMHAMHRHKQEWAAYSEYLEGEREQENIDRQERQLEATLAIARGAVTPAKPVGEIVACDVDGCGYEGTKNQVRGHKMGSHK